MKKISLILLFLNLAACSTTPVATSFDGDWEFLTNDKGEIKACLGKEDVKKLREILIRCGRK